MNKQPVAQHQQWWQRSPLLVLFAGVAVCFFVYRGFFYERKPASNSPAYKAAHGLVEGQVNELRVRGVLLRFPPAFFPNPYSADDIIAGQADSVTVDLDLADWFDPPPLARSPFLALVPITIARYGVETPDLGQRQLARQWKSVADRPELGLREYVETRDNGGWGYRKYVPLNGSAKTPRGGLIVYSCSGSPGEEPNWCQMYFQHKSGPTVEYYLSWKLIPRWSKVHAEVLRTVDSLIVQ
jgi:hypothetical protein